MSETTNNVMSRAVTDPIGSTDMVWYKDNMEYSASDKFDAVDASVTALQTGKADASHTHDGYAAADHTHSQYTPLTTFQAATATMETALAGKSDTSHTHTEYAATSHDHDDDYSAIGHNHSYNDLTNKPTIPEAYTHPTSHPASMITGLATVATSGSYDDLSDKPTIPTVPSSLPANGGNADTVDNMHASDFATAGHNHDDDYADASHTHAQADILGLTTALSTKANANHSHDEYALSADLAALETTVSGKASTSHTHSNYATTTELEALETTVSGKANTNHTHDYAATNHNHDDDYVAKELCITTDEGGVQKAYFANEGKDLLVELMSLSIGVHTVYSQDGVTNNPKAGESWRCLLHKSLTDHLWVIAFGSNGSIYTNYYNGTVAWRGWKCVYDASPSPLWTGAEYMVASDIVSPSKKLSECKNGWILMWSDYDESTATANNNDIVTSVIYKKSLIGGTWNGHAHYFDIPHYHGSTTATDSSEEKRIIKRLYIYDDKITGHDANSLGTNRKDVVLRAVYEF